MNLTSIFTDVLDQYYHLKLLSLCLMASPIPSTYITALLFFANERWSFVESFVQGFVNVETFMTNPISDPDVCYKLQEMFNGTSTPSFSYTATSYRGN